jgi:hypothetical protein
VGGFVLTSEEKRVLIFILSAFLLGVATKEYRVRHPVAATAPKIALKSRPQRTSQSAQPNTRQAAEKPKSEALGSD